MIDYTTVQLINDVKREGSVPENQNLYEDADFAASMDSCQKMRVVPALLNCREEFFVKVKDYNFNELTNLGDQRLALTLPPRTLAGRIRGLQLIDASTNQVTAQLDRLAPESNEVNNWNRQQRFGYMFQGNQIIIPEDISATDVKLRLKYFRRPNKIVDISQAGKVTAVNTMTGSVTLDNLPEGMVAGINVDIISQNEPFESLDSIPVISTGSSAILIDVATAAQVAVGDYVCFEFETVIPQLPLDVNPILVQYTVANVLKSLGDNSGASAVMTDLPLLEKSIYDMIQGRDEGSARKIIAPGGIWTRTRNTRWSRW